MADKNNDIFLELVGPAGPVAGGSTDDQFAGQIELESFSFTVVPVPRRAVKPPAPPSAQHVPDKTNATPPKHGHAGRGANAALRNDTLTVVKRVDKASPVLLQGYCKHLLPAAPGGQAPLFQKAALTFRLSRGGAPLKLLVLLLTGVAVIDYQLQSVDYKSTHPKEKVSFSYKTLEIQYRPEQNLSRSVSLRSVTFEKTKRQLT